MDGQIALSLIHYGFSNFNFYWSSDLNVDILAAIFKVKCNEISFNVHCVCVWMTI